jgi:hypothetical protein
MGAGPVLATRGSGEAVPSDLAYLEIVSPSPSSSSGGYVTILQPYRRDSHITTFKNDFVFRCKIPVIIRLTDPKR